VIITSFGICSECGSRSSLQKVRAEGADVRIVYSTMEPRFAQDNPTNGGVFRGPVLNASTHDAVSVLQAKERE